MNDRNPRTPFQEAVSMISIASVLVGIGCYVAAINEVPLVSEFLLSIAAVERGDAMRLMEQTGVVAHAALTKIFRQKIAALRDAVYDLSAGNTESGFSKLDAFGAIHEVVDSVERLEAIASQHIAVVAGRFRRWCGIVRKRKGSCVAKSTQSGGWRK
jgi:hypothetical protein